MNAVQQLKAYNLGWSIEEIARLQPYLQAWGSADSPYFYESIAGLWWGTYVFAKVKEHNVVRVWEDGQGEIVAFASFEGDFINPMIAPTYRADHDLAREILEWGMAEAKSIGETELNIWGQELEGDYCEFLEGEGYGLKDDRFHLVNFWQDITGPLPEIAPLEGITVRNVAGEHEYAERAAAHRDAFEPSKFTEEVYQRARESLMYRPELDIIAVIPDGTIASYCLVWFDPVRKIGEFEPVGTRHAYQNKGIGKRVMMEGLRRLKALGAESALVNTGHQNESGTALYLSVGFEIVDRSYIYVKDVPVE